MIRLINLGGISEGFILDGIVYYKKKISYYTDIDIILPSKRFKSSTSKKKLQHEFVLPYLSDGHNVLFDISGKKYSSYSFAQFIEKLITSNKKINFIVGGDEGFDEKTLEKASNLISFSDMTFNHELFFLMLLEQIYRAFTIIRNHPYHK